MTYCNELDQAIRMRGFSRPLNDKIPGFLPGISQWDASKCNASQCLIFFAGILKRESPAYSG